MAKTKRQSGENGRGPIPLQDQIKRLEEKVGQSGVRAAKQLVNETDHSIIRLAFKMLPKQGGGTTVGKNLESILQYLPQNQRAGVQAALLAAKQARRAAALETASA